MGENLGILLAAIDENRVNLTCLYLVNYNKTVVATLLSVHLINVKFCDISFEKADWAEEHNFSGWVLLAKNSFSSRSEWKSAWKRRPDTQTAGLLKGKEVW